MRRAIVLVVVCLAALAPVVGTVGAVDAGSSPSAAATTGDRTAAANGSTVGVDAAQEAPPDPESDRLGWEAGYWYNESLSVDQSDGLSDSERAAVVARTMARVEHVRQLEFTGDVPVTVISRATFRNQSMGGSPSPALRTFDNAKFEALFLINESADSLAVQQANAGSSILGYYSPTRNEIVLVAEGGDESALRLDELTLAHELLHALQDQHFNLSRYHGSTRDEVNANDGLVEGDAKYTEHRYRSHCQGGDWNGTCVTPSDSGSGGGQLANIGVYFVKYFPYSDGPGFVSHFYEQGGWAAVNALYEDPPASAEQVVHPEKYGTDAPANVSLSDETTDAWTRVRPPGRTDYAELGQSSLAAMFAYTLYAPPKGNPVVGPRTWLNYTESGEISQYDPLNYGYSLVDGWDGDKMYVYQNEQNETAYVWRLVWDSPAEASEFADGYRQLLRYWGASQVADGVYVIRSGGFADAFHVSVEGDTVTIVNAPTRDQLSEVRTGLQTTNATTTAAGTTTGSDATTTSTSGTADDVGTTTPGFGVLAGLIAVLATVLVLRRRR